MRVLIRHAPTRRPLDRHAPLPFPGSENVFFAAIADSRKNRSTCQHSPAYRLTIH
jgi:hypothetical protein